jgi:hypothetical protein
MHLAYSGYTVLGRVEKQVPDLGYCISFRVYSILGSFPCVGELSKVYVGIVSPASSPEWSLIGEGASPALVRFTKVPTCHGP